MDVRLSKVQLRGELEQRRLALGYGAREIAAEHISEKVLQVCSGRSVSTLHSYLPIASRGEVDSRIVIQRLLMNYPELRLAVPGSRDREQLSPKWHDPGTFSELSGRHSIDLPDPNTTAYDVILVPLLGFDTLGYRLGYGGGYYDAFLATQPQAFTIGLAYEASRQVDDLPREPHDVPLDCVVTERRNYSFG
jgi:5,10-methenyltetrahydrofolate synthetase